MLKKTGENSFMLYFKLYTMALIINRNPIDEQHNVIHADRYAVYKLYQIFQPVLFLNNSDQNDDIQPLQIISR